MKSKRLKKGLFQWLSLIGALASRRANEQAKCIFAAQCETPQRRVDYSIRVPLHSLAVHGEGPHSRCLE